MTDARKPTYDQLSALCAQMAAALETVRPSVMRYAPEASCREFEAALTAYRTLSPDPQGYYLASFKREDRDCYVIWWAPDNKGYTTDLKQAGIYTTIEPGYHDSEYTVPVPVGLAKHFAVRHHIDMGDSLNAPIRSAKALREWIANRARGEG